MKTTKILLLAVACMAFAACTKDTPQKGNVLPGTFSVSAVKKVHFSKGNLQATYNGSSYSWGFAQNQYDFIGNAAGNTTIDNQTVGAVVDMFGWVGATSTVLTDNNAQYGICTSETDSDYGIVANDVLKKEWGSTIDNAGTWFTLSNDEWLYLLGKSTSGRSASLCKYGVTVCNKANCLVIAPDNFTGTIAESYDAAAWSSAEAAGLVCLPAAGMRTGSEVTHVDVYGCYWSVTSYGTNQAFYLFYNNSGLNTYSGGRKFGYPVRLVTTAQ